MNLTKIITTYGTKDEDGETILKIGAIKFTIIPGNCMPDTIEATGSNYSVEVDDEFKDYPLFTSNGYDYNISKERFEILPELERLEGLINLKTSLSKNLENKPTRKAIKI